MSANNFFKIFFNIPVGNRKIKEIKLTPSVDGGFYLVIPPTMTSFSTLFYGEENIVSIDARVDTKNVTDMSDMFYGCSSLKELN